MAEATFFRCCFAMCPLSRSCRRTLSFVRFGKFVELRLKVWGVLGTQRPILMFKALFHESPFAVTSSAYGKGFVIHEKLGGAGRM